VLVAVGIDMATERIRERQPGSVGLAPCRDRDQATGRERSGQRARPARDIEHRVRDRRRGLLDRRSGERVVELPDELGHAAWRR
jgi:hypothetical protein